MLQEAAGPGGVRLVLLTQTTQVAQQPRALSDGFSSVLTLPVRLQTLLRAIAKGLPAPSDEDAHAAAEQAAGGNNGHATAPAGDDRPLRVLLVEDNRTNRLVAVRMLERLACAVDTAENGQEGLEAVCRGLYDVVLMDCQMPVMDGFSATEAIRRADGEAGRTPIVAMTANAMQGDRERCLAAGMDDYIAKPVQLDELKRVLASLPRRTVDVGTA
jgi:CheY-like chemotaxis protein